MQKFLLSSFAVMFVQLCISQTNDLVIDSSFNRFNVGEFYSNGIEYYRLPQDQLRPLNCSALVSNIGTNDITNCFIKVDVKQGGSVIMTEYSDSIDIISGNQDSLFLTAQFDFTGQPQGLYTIIYSVDSDSMELNLADNLDSLSFEITQNQLSRSNFIITDSTNNYYQDSLSGFGYVFKVENDACLSAVYPWMSFDPVNSSAGIGGVSATLFVLDTVNNAYNLAGVSGFEMPVTTANMGSTVEIPFDHDNELVAGNIYLITVFSQWHDFYLSQYSIDSTILYSYPSGQPGGTYDQNDYLINSRMIKMDIAFNGGPYCNLGIEDSRKMSFKVYPNPSGGLLHFEVENSIGSEVKVEIFSLNGQMVFEQRSINQSIFHLDIENLPNGIYSIHMINENERITEKLIIQR